MLDSTYSSRFTHIVRYITAIILTLFMSITLFGCSSNNSNDTGTKAKTSGPADTEYVPPETFNEITMDEAIDYFESGKTGILYFGFEKCPWCKEAKPILKKVAEKEGMTINYIKVRNKKGDRLYSDEQKARIQNYISDYMSENEDGVLTLYVPLVLTVKKGQVLSGHESTVEGHDAHKRKMKEGERKELKKIYTNMIEEYMEALRQDDNSSENNNENNSAPQTGCDESDVCTNSDDREED